MHDTPISVDEIWTLIKEEARRISLSEPALSNLLDETILSREDIFDSISLRLARKLGRHAMGEVLIYQISRRLLQRTPPCAKMS